MPNLRQHISNIHYKSKLAIGTTRRTVLRPKSYSYKGVNVEIDYEQIPATIIDHMLGGLYETDELSVIENLLEPDDTVVDIGAGIGFVSSFIAKGLSDSGSIECFEANPALISKIEHTHHLNGVSMSVKNIILGDEEGEVDFYVSPHFWASSTIKAPNTKLCKVPSISFQDYIYEKEPNFIVVDIEGGEIDLFSALDFHSIDKICIELHPNFTGLDKMNAMLNYMNQNGFEINEDISQVAVKAMIIK